MHAKRLVAAVAAFALVVVAGAAYATIPDGQGMIHACYKSRGGAVRVIDPGVAQCARDELALDWNRTGPQGAPGSQGPKGDTGATGPQGPPGTNGVSGRQVVYMNGTVNGFSTETLWAVCPSGKVPVGGGVSTGRVLGADGNITDSYPTADGWYGRVYNPNLGLMDFDVWAICVNA